MKNIKVKEVVKYGGHNQRNNGSVTLTLKAMYSELVRTLQITQFLNNDVTLKAKIPGSKPIKLGMFRVDNIRIDNDGESIIRFNGLNDYIEMDNLNLLPLSGDEVEEFAVLMEAEIEEEQE
jgi:hypothetical protein